MSVLTSLKNIKVPYASEGVIRTAQLDDTVAPENSVQLAVNMNFDRVGAIQTRPGVTQYADDLVAAINSYGTLRNSIVSPGYERIAQFGSISDIVSSMSNPSAVKISNTKIVIFWTDPTDSKGKCRQFSIDEERAEIVALGSTITFEATLNSENCAIKIDNSYVLNVWRGVDGDGFVQAFAVITDTVSPQSTALEFDTANGQQFSLSQVNSNHFICFYEGTGSIGVATIFEVNSGSHAVTEPGSPLTFDAVLNQANSCASLGDGIHFINFWIFGKAQVFSVNTGTWAITAVGSPLVYSTNGLFSNVIAVGDGQHFVNIYQGNSGGFTAQAFNVNLSTYTVTTVGTSVAINSAGGNDLTGVGMGDGKHFVAYYSENVGEGFVQLIAMNSSTFNMSLVGNRIAGYSFSTAGQMSPIVLTAYEVLNVWSDSANVGQVAFFQTSGAVVDGSWLYAGSGGSIFNTPAPGGVYTSRRSGLAQVSKPRFAQYLNYEWMVNGNIEIGGDPVATSNGGNFGTDLVPENFPPGDFISAGFEGRVWIANKTLGVIYYTDIVQFIPPSTYTLTYNSEVNFISELSPQTGQEFTALIEVPRALLVFTQDTITRIYGASSVDAYAAYNVGTYSQESIVTTKTGIFFHHSSGFYQFDYGSQPVEISRRIIDFVKAIPRANYDDIIGVYDGFDCVKWYVGQVTVEGVVFRNCMVRYTISTQVWTIYDYSGINITALIGYDDGATVNQIVGATAGSAHKTGVLDVGETDFGNPFYFEFIDRWRAFTQMYYIIKAISGVNIYSENAGGSTLKYQVQKSGPNAWQDIGTVTEANNTVIANAVTDDFDVIRLRLVGNTKGPVVVFHGIELLSINIKGQNVN